MRLIDADALLELYDKKDWSEMDDEEWDDLRVSLRLVKQNILDMPTIDAVPIVRCRDCKWCDVTDYGAGEVLECIRNRLYRINSISLEGEAYFRKVEPDDYCSWGERRTDDA